MQELMSSVLQAVENAHPLTVWIALSLLPLLPVPASVLWIATGVRFGPTTGFILALTALAVNQTLGYLGGRHCFRSWLDRWIRGMSRRLPQFETSDEWRWILLFRLTPGIPLFLQNYVLGFLRVRFGLYLPLSLALHVGYVAAFVWGGHAVRSSSAWQGGVVVAGLISLWLIVKVVRTSLGKRLQVRATNGNSSS